jgi:deoxyribodipyrimidine photo-lyase
MLKKISLVLFDQDLRLSDNPAFFHAVSDEKNCEILPLFILDEKNKRQLGEASKWFLYHALSALTDELQKNFSLNLILKKGDSLEILAEIFAAKKISKIYFNQLCEPYNIKLQNEILKLAEKNSIEVFSFKSQTLFDKGEIKNQSGNYFKVFTPFWKECSKNFSLIGDLLPTPSPRKIAGEKNLLKDGLSLQDLQLFPRKNWAKKFAGIWEFDPQKIRINFAEFLNKRISNYKQARDIPDLEGTAKISPHLHFGLISVREIFWMVKNFQNSAEIFREKSEVNSLQGISQFLAEIGWREFCHHLLMNFPELQNKSFRPEFENFPWIKNDDILHKWQKGQTGFPIIDAGMRELWAVGWMHNRVRMIVASFLIKDLLIDWREGEKYFWDCLCDADLASNCASWQWVAGSGADAAPYFRIFNPTLQGERFDADGNYVRKWIPEIAKLPNRFIHKPWLADEKTLKDCKIELGKTYPKAILNHEAARNMALMAFRTLKGS